MNPMEVSSAFLLGVGSHFIRALGVVILLPLGEGISGFSRKMTVAFSLALLGDIQPHFEYSPSGIFGELITGITLSLPLALWITGMGWLGTLFDIGRGQHLFTLYDPMALDQEPISGILLRNLGWGIAVLNGGLELVISEYVDSLDKVISPSDLTSSSFWNPILSLITSGATAAIQQFLPFALLFIVTELGLGLASKISGLDFFAKESFLVKTSLGTALLIHVVSSSTLWARFP